MKLGDRKLKTENFDIDLKLLIGQCFYDALTKEDVGVCRSCHTKVLNTSSFVQQIRNSTKTFLESPFTLKRGVLSPHTPQSVSTNEANLTVTQKSRKRLKIHDDNADSLHSEKEVTKKSDVGEESVTKKFDFDHQYHFKSDGSRIKN